MLLFIFSLRRVSSDSANQFGWIIISSIVLDCIRARYRENIKVGSDLASFQKLANRILLWFTKISKFAAKDKGPWQNVSFVGTMWEHKGRLETQYCACARDVSNGLHQKISSTFCEEASSCSKRMCARKIDGESISQRDVTPWKQRERKYLTCLTFFVMIYGDVMPRDISSIKK